jgi:hypothetical protein
MEPTMRSKGRARTLTVFLLKQDAPATLQKTLATVELPVSLGMSGRS